MQDAGLIKNEIDRVLLKEAELDRLKLLLDTPGNFDNKLWLKAQELGWSGLAFDEDVGGLGLSWRGLSELNEALGAATAALPLSQSFLLADLLQQAKNANEFSGLQEQLCSGVVTAGICLSEPEHASLTAPSIVRWDGKALNGSKSLTAFANVADMLLVSAISDAKVTLLLVDTKSTGVAREVVPAIDNARAYAKLSFTHVPAQEVLLAESGEAALQSLLNKAVVMTAFEQLGGARAALNLAVAYAKERIAFGGPIGRYQAIKHKLADVYAAVEIAQGCALEALIELESGQLSIASACAARLAATHAYELASRDAIQVFGGIGVTWEAAPHHHYRRSRCLAVELGGTEFWQELLLTAMRSSRRGKKS
jgi:alkylation response protein AidB-like acyl-CoA dehydrogenase